MFELDKDLKTLILENLPEDGLSISALTRRLNERGIKIHRLELSGYLKALSDLAVLREREVKPSKVFCPAIHRKRNIYDLLGEAVRTEEKDEDEQTSLALYVLCRLLKRPVFERELRMCGLTGTPNAVRAGERERIEARTIVLRAGLKIPTNEIAFLSEEDRTQQYVKILADLLIEFANLRQLISETKQKTLEEG